jgi:hypothetical protein
VSFIENSDTIVHHNQGIVLFLIREIIKAVVVAIFDPFKGNMLIFVSRKFMQNAPLNWASTV